MDKRLKKCSGVESTDVDDVNKSTKPLLKPKRGLCTSKNQRKLKKHSKKSEIKELTSTFKKLTKAIEKLEKVLSDNPDNKLVKKNETPKKYAEESTYECTFESDNCENNADTIFVKGFDYFRCRDDIKRALISHFSSCGRITRIYIPVECRTGASLGFAFLDFRKGDRKALSLSGSNLGGRIIHVSMARHREESSTFANFRGCKKCAGNVMRRNMRRYYDRVIPISYSF